MLLILVPNHVITIVQPTEIGKPHSEAQLLPPKLMKQESGTPSETWIQWIISARRVKAA